MRFESSADAGAIIAFPASPPESSSIIGYPDEIMYAFWAGVSTASFLRVGGVVMSAQSTSTEIIYQSNRYPEWKRHIFPRLLYGILMMLTFIFIFLLGILLGANTEDFYLLSGILIVGIILSLWTIAAIPIVILDHSGIYIYPLLGKKIWQKFFPYTQIDKVIYNEKHSKIKLWQYILNIDLKNIFFLVTTKKRGRYQNTVFIINIKYIPKFDYFLRILSSRNIHISPKPPYYFRRFGEISQELRNWIFSNTPNLVEQENRRMKNYD